MDIQNNEHNFSEPTRIYSNVAGGYGIFGSYNVARKTAELELLKTPQTPEQPDAK